MERGETSSSSSALEDPQSSAASCPVAMAYPSLMAPGPVPVVHHVLVESVENQLPERPVISSSMTCRVSLAIRQTFAAVHLLFKLLTTAITSILQGVAVVGLGATRGVFLLSPSSVLGSCLRCWPTPCSTASRWLPWSSLWRGRSSLQILPHSWRAERLGSQLAAHRTSFAGIMKTVFAILSYGNEFISCYVWILIVWLCGLLHLVCKPATQRCLKIRHCKQPIQPLRKASVSMSTFVEFMVFLACMLISCTVQSSRSHDVEWMRDIDDSFLRNKRMNFWVTFIICSLSRVFLRRTGNMLFARLHFTVSSCVLLCSQAVSMASPEAIAGNDRSQRRWKLKSGTRSRRPSHRQIKTLSWLAFVLCILSAIRNARGSFALKDNSIGGLFRTFDYQPVDIDLSLDEAFALLGIVMCWVWIVNRSLIKWLSTPIYVVCHYVHPPTLRYTLAGGCRKALVFPPSVSTHKCNSKKAPRGRQKKEVKTSYAMRSLTQVKRIHFEDFCIDWDKFYASERTDTMKNISREFIAVGRTCLEKVASELYMAGIVVFAATFATSCAACFAFVSLLALLSFQVDAALEDFVVNIIKPRYCSSRTSLPRSTQLRFPSLVLVLCSTALVCKGNICCHGLDSPMFWFWVFSKQHEQYAMPRNFFLDVDNRRVDASFAKHARIAGLIAVNTSSAQPDSRSSAENGPAQADSETLENSIEKVLTTVDVLQFENVCSVQAERPLGAAEYSEPRVRRKNQGSRQRMLQRRSHEIIASFTSHKRKMAKFFSILNNSSENQLPLCIKHKLAIAYHKLLSSQSLSTADQYVINRTFHQLSAGFFSIRFSPESAQSAAQPSFLELAHGGTINGEEADDMCIEEEGQFRDCDSFADPSTADTQHFDTDAQDTDKNVAEDVTENANEHFQSDVWP